MQGEAREERVLLIRHAKEMEAKKGSELLQQVIDQAADHGERQCGGAGREPLDEGLLMHGERARMEDEGGSLLARDPAQPEPLACLAARRRGREGLLEPLAGVGRLGFRAVEQPLSAR